MTPCGTLVTAKAHTTSSHVVLWELRDCLPSFMRKNTWRGLAFLFNQTSYFTRFQEDVIANPFTVTISNMGKRLVRYSERNLWYYSNTHLCDRNRSHTGGLRKITHRRKLSQRHYVQRHCCRQVVLKASTPTNRGSRVSSHWHNPVGGATKG